jgi:hypothetical protein
MQLEKFFFLFDIFYQRLSPGEVYPPLVWLARRSLPAYGGAGLLFTVNFTI